MPECLLTGPYCLAYCLSEAIRVCMTLPGEVCTFCSETRPPSHTHTRCSIVQSSPVWLPAVESPNRQCGVGVGSGTQLLGLAVLLAGCGTPRKILPLSEPHVCLRAFAHAVSSPGISFLSSLPISNLSLYISPESLFLAPRVGLAALWP